MWSSSSGWWWFWFVTLGAQLLERRKQSATKPSYVWWSASVEWCSPLDSPGSLLQGVVTTIPTGLRETFQALFTVFNSFQGFFILCLQQGSQGIQELEEVLSCSRYTSQFLHPSQTRNVSTSGAFAKNISTELSSSLPKSQDMPQKRFQKSATTTSQIQLSSK